MSREEVASLLTACVTSSNSSSSGSGASPPRILAIRDPESGTIIPFSLALKHLASLWSKFELIDDSSAAVITPPKQTSKLSSAASSSSAAAVAGRPQSATSKVPTKKPVATVTRVSYDEVTPTASASSLRPSSSPATTFATSKASIAGLPTPVMRHSNGIDESRKKQQNASAKPQSANPQATGHLGGRWGYLERETSPAASSSSAEHRATSSRARINNYMNSNVYSASPASSSPAAPPSFKSSPAFSSASSKSSYLDGNSQQQQQQQRPGSGIHVVLSYDELLSILTGHTPSHINTGSRPSTPHLMFVLSIVQAGLQKCEDIFLQYQNFSSSKRFNNIVFLIIESHLLKGTTLECATSTLPVFQMFLDGHLLGQLNQPTISQLEGVLRVSQKLVEDNPDLRVLEEEEYENESEDEEERGWRQAAQRSLQQQRPISASPRQRAQSFGEVLDSESAYILSPSERNEVFQNLAEEEARWAQLLQASPSAAPTRPSRSAYAQLGESPLSMASESPQSPEALESDAEEDGFTAPPSMGLVIRGTKVTLHAPSKDAQQRQRQQASDEDGGGRGYTAPPSAGLTIQGQKMKIHPAPASGSTRLNPESRLRDWSNYERFDEALEESEDEDEDDGHASRKRKNNPVASDEDDDSESGVQIADGGSENGDSRQFNASVRASAGSSIFNSLSSSPSFTSRNSTSSSTFGGPTSAASSFGMVMNPSEARSIERILLRQDRDIQAAFRQAPELEKMVEVFMRLVATQVDVKNRVNTGTNTAYQAHASKGQQTVNATMRSQGTSASSLANQLANTAAKIFNPFEAPNSSSSSSSNPNSKNLTATPSKKRKEHPAISLLEQQKHKRFQAESMRVALQAAAAARLRNKRRNRVIYGPGEIEETYHEEEEKYYSEAVRKRLQHKRMKIYASDDENVNTSREEDGGDFGDASTSAALAQLQTQQKKYSDLQRQYGEIQNEIFSKTVHDLHQHQILTSEQLDLLVYLWTNTEQGSDRIREWIKEYEIDGKEIEFMKKLVELARDGMEIDEEEEEEEDGEEEEEDDDPDALGPDEERAYQAMIRRFSQMDTSSPNARAAPPTSTKAPRPSPAKNQDADEEEEAYILILSQLASSKLLTARQIDQARSKIFEGHAGMHAAFLAFRFSDDLEELEELASTIRIILKREGGDQQKDESSVPMAQLSDASQLLTIMPPWIVASHQSALEDLVAEQDIVLLSAWSLLQEGVTARFQASQLAVLVEDFIDTIVRRIEAKQEQAVESSQSPAADELSPHAALVDALQIISVLHTGNIFNEEETAILWTLLLRNNPVIQAAFDLSREEEDYDELHDTLQRLIVHHAHLKSQVHAILPLLNQATGILSAKDVAMMRELVSPKPGEGKKANSASASKTSAAPVATAASSSSSSSTLTPGWNRITQAFTQAVTSIRSKSNLSDSSLRLLVQFFQDRHSTVVSACQVFELDGNQAEFEDSLREIANVIEESQKANETAGKSAATASSSSAKSFADRVQDESQGEEEEEEENQPGDEDETGSVDSLDELLARDSVEDWDEASIQKLYAKVTEMQNQLTMLKAMQGDDEDDEDGEDDEEDEEESKSN